MASKGGLFLRSKSTGKTGLGRLKKTNVALTAAAVAAGTWALADPNADEKIQGASEDLFGFVGSIFSGAFGGLFKALLAALVPCCSVSSCLLIAYFAMSSFSLPSMSPRQ